MFAIKRLFKGTGTTLMFLVFLFIFPQVLLYFFRKETGAPIIDCDAENKNLFSRFIPVMYRYEANECGNEALIESQKVYRCINDNNKTKQLMRPVEFWTEKQEKAYFENYKDFLGRGRWVNKYTGCGSDSAFFSTKKLACIEEMWTPVMRSSVEQFNGFRQGSPIFFYPDNQEDYTHCVTCKELNNTLVNDETVFKYSEYDACSVYDPIVYNYLMLLLSLLMGYSTLRQLSNQVQANYNDADWVEERQQHPIFRATEIELASATRQKAGFFKGAEPANCSGIKQDSGINNKISSDNSSLSTPLRLNYV